MKYLCFAFVLLFTTASLSAESLPGHKISLKQKKVGLRDLLTSLLDETGLKYRLSNNVTNDKKVSVDVKEAKWSEVFQFVVDKGDLNYRMTAKKMLLISP